MSKQEHDKDEQRAPSGASGGKTPGNASRNPATEKSAQAPPDAGQKTLGDGKAVPATGKRGANKSASGKQGASKPVDPSKPGAPGKGADTAKPLTDTRDSKPSQDEAAGQKAAATDQKPPGATSPSKTGPASPDTASSSSASSSGTTAPGHTTSAAGGGAAGGGTNAATARRSGGGGSGMAGIIALILAVLLALLVVIGGWWVWQELSGQQQQLSRIESNTTAIAELESQLGERDQQLEQQMAQQLEQQREQALQSMRNEMQQYREEVNQTLDRVLEELASEQEADPGEWLYAEVEYLLRLANQRLQLERDVAGARSLLRTADERLTEADNPALTPVRRAIQTSLGELGSVPSVDRTGIYLSLMAQQEQLAKLPLQQDIEQIAAEGGDTSTMEGAWREQLSRFGQELKELVVVRRHDQALEALMTPEQESYLRQNVRLQLEQAQLSLLQANPELYQASLEKASTLIEGYYDTEHDGVQEALEQLRSLSDKTIRPELPDISNSLQALRDFMARRQDGGSADE